MWVHFVKGGGSILYLDTGSTMFWASVGILCVFPALHVNVLPLQSAFRCH